MNLSVYDIAGAKVGTYEIDPADLAPSVNKQLLHDAVVMYQANLRQGTQKTKTRGEVAGSTKKLYRQKGTGNARAGARRSGTRRGGGHIFAKRPRDFGWRMPRKALQAATRMALAARLADEEVKLVDSISLSSPKTATMATLLSALGLSGQTVLVTPESHDANLWKSARNIEGVSVAPVADLNALSILMPRGIVMTKGAIEAIRKSAAAAKPKPATSKKRSAAGKSAATGKSAVAGRASGPSAKRAALKTKKA